jgi:hypothetical protein
MTTLLAPLNQDEQLALQKLLEQILEYAEQPVIV